MDLDFDTINFSSCRIAVEEDYKIKKIKAELKLLRLKYARLKYKYNLLSSQMDTIRAKEVKEFVDKVNVSFPIIDWID